MASRRRPYRAGPKLVKNSTTAAPSAELMIYEEIGGGFFGGGISAKDFVEELRALTDDHILIRINSPGGDVFDGLAIANAIQTHTSRITTQVDGLAASIASVIAIAGDEVRMAENAFLMIHEPFTWAAGNAAEMRKLADTLDKVAGSLVMAYMHRTGQPQEQVKAWMAEETWFTAEEAKTANFVDTVGEAEDALAVAASFDLSVFAHTPERLVAALKEQTVPQIRVVERALRDAGYSRSSAKQMAAAAMATTHPRDAGHDEAGLVAGMKRLITTLT